MVLFKGHGKDRESDRSYRTISTCPLMSKALDKYAGRLFESGWANAQAETQFQGNGSSHELAALLLTETIQHSLFVDFQPVFVLFGCLFGWQSGRGLDFSEQSPQKQEDFCRVE